MVNGAATLPQKQSLRATSLPAPPPLSVLETSKDFAAARDWLKSFGGCSVPRVAVDITFARSSGPGGQNVNKVNTKATLRCPLGSSWIPLWAHDGLQKSPYFVRSTRSILLTSTVHRSQAQNIDDCLSKLHALISSASSRPIQNEPSEEQRKRVKALERKADAQRRIEKDKRSQTKKHRGSAKLDWD
ncbi:RF-1 domain containing protein [Lactarius tabidus]